MSSTLHMTLFGLLVVLLAHLAGTTTVRSADPKDGPKVAEVTLTKLPAITAPNFVKTFNSGIDSVDTLGYRLAAARKHHEPLTVALIAVELRALEEASGKKAEVTSADVEKWAVELAKVRRDSMELKMVAAIIKDATAIKELKELAETMAKAEADAAGAAKAGEKARGARMLTITNPTDEVFSIYVDGRYVGYLPPISTRAFNTAFTVAQPSFVVVHDFCADGTQSAKLIGQKLEHRFTIRN